MPLSWRGGTSFSLFTWMRNFKFRLYLLETFFSYPKHDFRLDSIKPKPVPHNHSFHECLQSIPWWMCQQELAPWSNTIQLSHTLSWRQSQTLYYGCCRRDQSGRVTPGVKTKWMKLSIAYLPADLTSKSKTTFNEYTWAQTVKTRGLSRISKTRSGWPFQATAILPSTASKQLKVLHKLSVFSKLRECMLQQRPLITQRSQRPTS